jgi:rubredoxin
VQGRGCGLKTIRTVSPGGVISTGSLRQLATHCQTADVPLRIGPRMDLQVQLPEAIVPEFTGRLREWVQFSSGEPNVISSACAPGGHAWLKESALLEAAESVHAVSTGMEVSLLDPDQALVPLFQSELNFSALPEEGTWSCALRLDGSVHMAAGRFLTQDLAETAAGYRAVRGNGLTGALAALGGPTSPPPVSAHVRPEYEGFQKHGGKWVLGFFCQNGIYDAALVEEMAYLCTKDSLGKVYLTPWHSFLIKGIADASLLVWDDFLRRRRIETRHASAQLFWRMLDAEPLLHRARKKIADDLSQMEVPLRDAFCAGMNTADDPSAFSIELAGTFPPRFRLFAREAPGQPRRKIGTYLLPFLPGAVRRLLEERPLTMADSAAKTDASKPREPAGHPKAVSYVCKECLNVYSEEYGDALTGLGPGVPFETLPASYVCPVCGAEKKHFRRAA